MKNPPSRFGVSRRAFAWFCLLLLGVLPTLVRGAAASWQVGDKIEVKWADKWFPASVIELKDGRCKIHYDGYGANWDEWVGPDRIRAANTLPAAATPTNSPWKVGEKVEAWNVTWYPAEIMVIGTDEHVGYFKVHYEGFSGASDQWVKADSVRARKVAAPPNTAGGPRLGSYRIQSYGAAGTAPLYLGDVELLAGGRYRVHLAGGKVSGEGTYAYDAATSAVTWLTGRYKDEAWGGGFEISREGKTHTLRLRRGTIATNSTD